MDRLILYADAWRGYVVFGTTCVLVFSGGEYCEPRFKEWKDAWIPQSHFRWAGTQAEWRILRTLSETPKDLIANARRLSLTPAENSTLEFLRRCGIDARGLEEAKAKIAQSFQTSQMLFDMYQQTQDTPRGNDSPEE